MVHGRGGTGGVPPVSEGGEDDRGDAVDVDKRIRMVDEGRKAYAGDTKQTLKKQTETIRSLTTENHKLKEEIQNAAKHSSVKHNIDHQNRIQKLTETTETLDMKIRIEQQRYDDSEAEINDCRKKSLEARRMMGGVSAARESAANVENQIKVLENRLDQALLKFNEALAFNKQLREQIDNLRRERVVFDGIYKKLEKELHEKKKQMADIIEKSNLYYEERDIATNELAALKNAAEKDMLKYEEYFRDLEAMIETDKSLKEKLKQSQKHKPSGASPTRRQLLDSAGSPSLASMDDGTTSSFSPSRRKQKEEGDDMGGKAEERYDEALEQLQAATGVEDLNQLLEKFQKAEEQNFSMYNFVNDLNNEVERLDEDLTEYKKEYDAQGGTESDAARSRTLKQLELKLAAVETQTEDYEAKLSRTQDSLGDLRGSVESTFNKLGCKQNQEKGDLSTANITDSNMMYFLGMIEQKTNEILQARAMQVTRMKSTSALDDDDEEVETQRPKEGAKQKISFVGQGPAVPKGSVNLRSVVGNNLPSTGDTFGADGAGGFEEAEEDRVLTQSELRQQTEARLAAKDEAGKGAGGPKRGAKPKKKKEF